MAAPKAPAPRISITERQWQTQVIGLARYCGWRVAHFRPALNAKGQWRTPVEADGKGYPDLTMARVGELLVVELKTEKGRLAPSQRLWLEVLETIEGIDVYVWKPSDWDAVHERLSRSALVRS